MNPEDYEKTTWLYQARQRSNIAALGKEAEDILGITENREIQEAVTKEFRYQQHIELYGRIPVFGNPIIDALANIGCPCAMCFRSEFI